jgi:hypothetical protein
MPTILNPVQSSNIFAIGHDPNSAVLTVQFKTKNGDPGALYEYEAVPAEVFNAFMEAESPGRFFASEVKGKFTSRKVAD